MRIAVLDTEPDQLRLINQSMASLGHECHTYAAGKALLHAMRRETFDLLVLDWRLPDMNGPDVVKTIRQDYKSRMPILFVTEHHDDSDMVEGLNVGADDFMAKPLSEMDLVNVLLSRLAPLPATPETPLSASRCYWEYIQRRYEQCERNVSKTAQHLCMHRRSLQRLLSKRAPVPRALL